jgi:hypothetical protein
MRLIQRCDGVRPICRPCRSKPEQYGDCEYTDSGFTTTEILEEKIALLEARLEELQRAEPTSSLVLHNPYSMHAGSAGTSNVEVNTLLLRGIPLLMRTVYRVCQVPSVTNCKFFEQYSYRH